MKEKDESNSLISKFSGVEIKKHILKKRIIRHLYYDGFKSVPDITKDTHMSSPTITQLINELIDEQWIKDYGRGESSGGRKPNLYWLRPDSHYLLIIDCGNYQTHIAIYNTINQPIAETTIKLTLVNEQIALDSIIDNAFLLLENSQIDKNKVIGLGIAFPGLVNSEKGINYTHFNFSDKPISDILQKRFGFPVFIENDAKAMALGEYQFGLAKGHKNALSITIDWGIGLGMILDGKLFHGTSGFAGEIGHIQMKPDGDLCICGKLGCLETVASASALTRKAKGAISNGRMSLLTPLAEKNIELIDASAIINAAKHGDDFAIDLLSEVGKELGKGLSVAIQIINPEIIILGGQIAEAEQFIITPIQQMLNKLCMSQMRNDANIVVSELGQNSRMLGMYAFAMENLLDESKGYVL